MTPILLSPGDIAIAAVLILLDGVLSLVLRLRLHWQLAIATLRMVAQLVLVGFILRAVFAIASPPATLLVVVVMVAIAGREVAARPEQRLGRFGNYAVGASAVAMATFLTAILALTTAIRPQPWYDPHYAMPLAGIILGNVLNGACAGARFAARRRGARARGDRGATGARRQLRPRHARPGPRLGPARPAADHQPMSAAGHHHPAGHHDRPDPRRDGPDGGGEIPDPADVPVVRRQLASRPLPWCILPPGA